MQQATYTEVLSNYTKELHEKQKCNDGTSSVYPHATSTDYSMSTNSMSWKRMATGMVQVWSIRQREHNLLEM